MGERGELDTSKRFQFSSFMREGYIYKQKRKGSAGGRFSQLPAISMLFFSRHAARPRVSQVGILFDAS